MLFAIIADRWTKHLSSRWEYGWSERLAFFRTRHLVTQSSQWWWAAIGFGIAAALVAIAARQPMARICLGAALGGAISNCLDEGSPEGTVNCFCLRGLRFNLADLSIVFGLAVGLGLLSIR